MPSAYDVFLSHASVDKAPVEALARRLREDGLNPFLDMWNLVPGEPWQEALEDALAQSRTCAVVVGRGEGGPWHNREMRVALDRQAENPSFRVIPVLLPGARLPNLPAFLRQMSWIRFRAIPNDDEAYYRLVSGIRGQSPGPKLGTNKSERKSSIPHSQRSLQPLNDGQTKRPQRNLLRISGWHDASVVGVVALLAIVTYFMALDLVERPRGYFYRVKVNLLDDDNQSLDDTYIQVSVEAEIKQIPGGWELAIPVENRPADGAFKVLARKKSPMLIGEAQVSLRDDFYQEIDLKLGKQADSNAGVGQVNASEVEPVRLVTSIKGSVVDAENKSVYNVRINALGYLGSSHTDRNGYFHLEIPTALVNGTEIRLHAEHPEYLAKDEYYFVGSGPASLVLREE